MSHGIAAVQTTTRNLHMNVAEPSTRTKNDLQTTNEERISPEVVWADTPRSPCVYKDAAVVCLYQVAALLALNLTLANSGLKLLIFLTQWAYIVLTLHTVVSAGLCFADYYMYYNSRSQRGEAASDDNHLSSDVAMATGSTAQLTTTGGTGLYDYPFIYPYLDYGSRPELAAVVAVLGADKSVPEHLSRARGPYVDTKLDAWEPELALDWTA
ncbi:hypothetical protein Bbelb_122190 [Branchiostoma belcheri]|nr:hypothetical protein Bbelb_122190 [Branchiostoma belcheri]